MCDELCLWITSGNSSSLYIINTRSIVDTKIHLKTSNCMGNILKILFIPANIYKYNNIETVNIDKLTQTVILWRMFYVSYNQNINKLTQTVILWRMFYVSYNRNINKLTQTVILWRMFYVSYNLNINKLTQTDIMTNVLRILQSKYK